MSVTETEQRECKKSLAQLKQGLVSLVAMLNKHGAGELWFGVSPRGKAVGLDVTEKTLRDVSQPGHCMNPRDDRAGYWPHTRFCEGASYR